MQLSSSNRKDYSLNYFTPSTDWRESCPQVMELTQQYLPILREDLRHLKPEAISHFTNDLVKVELPHGVQVPTLVAVGQKETFMAKSAATLLVLAANERLLTTSAQLGPVDPQVRHPEKGMFFPAHSIKEALERVEATTDPFVKIAMADKLDPFLIGAYQDAMSAAKQYIEEVVSNWQVPDKQAIVSAFTDRYKSHGYPIDGAVLRAIGVPYTKLTGQSEEFLCSLHEKCTDLLDDGEEEGAIILTKDEYIFRRGGFTELGRFATASQPPLPIPQTQVATRGAI